jgi:hypothetical protein
LSDDFLYDRHNPSQLSGEDHAQQPRHIIKSS